MKDEIPLHVQTAEKRHHHKNQTNLRFEAVLSVGHSPGRHHTVPLGDHVCGLRTVGRDGWPHDIAVFVSWTAQTLASRGRLWVS